MILERRMSLASALVLALPLLLGPTLPQTTLAADTDSGPPTLQKTTVHGDPPALAGRWLALGIIKLPSGTHRNIPALWEIAGAGKDTTLTVRMNDLPEVQKKAADSASDAEKVWEPSKADLDAIASAWDTLPAQAVRTESVETDISTHETLDDAAKAEATIKDAVWLVKQTFIPDAAAGPVIRQATIYAALARPGGE